MNLAQLKIEVEAIAKEAGGFIRQAGLNFNQEDVEVKSSNSFVSYVDKEAEAMIVDKLKSLLPEAGFIAEEGTEANTKPDAIWIIDPLDGTTNFIHSIPCFAVSIALEINGEIALGVVYEISNDECFSAYLNGGSFLNGNRIQVSQAQALKNTLIATGFPYYDYKRSDEYLHFMGYLMRNTRGLRRLGSAATDLAYVAAGRFDAFFEYGLSPWDVAAGVILVKEAGGKVSDFKGGSGFVYGQEIIASGPGISEEFTEELGQHFYPNK